jgi:hypothetical protein
MAEQYWVWALGRDNMPLTTEGPWGPYDALTARTYARISATEGTHDRAVSRGADPERFKVVRIYQAGTGEHIYAGGGVAANPAGVEYYDVKFVHKISPSDKDRMGPVAMPDNAFSDRNTLAKALRDAGVLHSGDRLSNFRVEGEKVIAFPAKSIWHAIVLTPSTEMEPNEARYREIRVPAKSYEDYDDSLTAAAHDYADEHGLENWEVEARWADDQRDEIVLTVPSHHVPNEARPHGELNWYKITYSAPAGGTAVTHVRAPNSLEALERAAFQLGYEPDVWSIEGMLNGDWTRL